MMRPFFQPVAWLVSTVSVCATYASAQTLAPNVEQALRQTQSEIARQRVPQTLPEQKELDLWVPSGKPSSKPEASEQKTIDVAKVRVVGSSWLSADQVNGFFAPLQGQKVSLDAMRQVADQMEAKYRSAGFFLARVFVPLQQDAQGGLEIRVIEGYVSDVVLEGATEAVRQQLHQSLQQVLVGKRPISMADFEALRP